MIKKVCIIIGFMMIQLEGFSIFTFWLEESFELIDETFADEVLENIKEQIEQEELVIV